MNFEKKKIDVLKEMGKLNSVQIISHYLPHDGTTHDNVNEQIHLVSLFINDCERKVEQECDHFYTDTLE